MVRNTGMLAILAATIVCACSDGCAAQTQSSRQRSPKLQPLQVRGEQIRNGIFDAALEYGGDGTGWMAYSSIEIPRFVETHIAKSLDHGATWTFVSKPNSAAEAKFEDQGGAVKAVWRYETPCLLFDPTDKVERRWKLFTNRYPVLEPYNPTDRRMSDGTIDVQYATTADGSWSEPIKLIGLKGQCRFDLAKADRSLADVRALTEPGVIMLGGVIYMSLDVGSSANGLGNWEGYRVILLASPDHGETWRYVGTLLDHKDAMRFQYLVFTGTSLVREQGKLYLLATPSGATNKERHDHDGTMIMALEDIKSAKVARDAAGTPIVVKRIKVNKQSGGLADYDEQNTAGGIVLSQLSLWEHPLFQLWNTGETVSGTSAGRAK